MDQPVLANVQVACSGAAPPPVVRFAFDEVFLERIVLVDAPERTFAQIAHLLEDALLMRTQRAQLPAAVMDDSYRRREAVGLGTPRDLERINNYNPFQKHLVEGKANNWWWCRAGARYLYICEDGLVHYCSQQRGHPAIPLEQYTREDIRREYMTKKACAPYCTVSCVHQVSVIDRWRDRQTLEFSGKPSPLVQVDKGS